MQREKRCCARRNVDARSKATGLSRRERGGGDALLLSSCSSMLLGAKRVPRFRRSGESPLSRWKDK
jgi:hypothetical protein